MPYAPASADRRPARRRSLAALAVLWLAGGAAGCGQAGPLYLPAEPATETADAVPSDNEADDSGDDD